MKRVVALIAAVIVCASFLVVPASAAETTSTTMSFNWNRGGNIISGSFAVPRYDSSYVGKRELTGLTAGSKYYTSVDEFALDVEQMYSGSVGMYISYYYNCDTSVGGEWVTQTTDYDGYYTNDVGNTGTVPSVEFSSFSPAGGTNPSQGYRMSVHFVGEPSLPISGLGVRRVGSVAQAYFVPAAAAGSCNFYLNVPSATVVGVASSDELTALEGMADQIAAQNEILNAMYGEIVSICNQIYQVCGDMVEAQNLTNQYFSQIIPILNSMNATTSNIYVLLQNQFALLLAAIQRESGNLQDVIIDESGNIQTVLRTESEAIQDAIDQAVVDLIAYLDSVFQGAVGVLPEQNESTDRFIDSLFEAEGSVVMSIEESLPEILPSEPVFDSQLVAGFVLVNTIFGMVWEEIGDFKFIYIFSLTLGIALLAIGRISRFAGVGSRHGGPKASPSKGGSDGA